MLNPVFFNLFSKAEPFAAIGLLTEPTYLGGILRPKAPSGVLGEGAASHLPTS